MLCGASFVPALLLSIGSSEENIRQQIAKQYIQIERKRSCSQSFSFHKFIISAHLEGEGFLKNMEILIAFAIKRRPPPPPPS